MFFFFFAEIISLNIVIKNEYTEFHKMIKYLYDICLLVCHLKTIAHKQTKTNYLGKFTQVEYIFK